MPTTKKRRVFPFTAVIGQEEMKLALVLNVIDPRIGGVMIMGDRGTGKSTTIRALADLLPAIDVVKDDPYNLSLIHISEPTRQAVKGKTLLFFVVGTVLVFLNIQIINRCYFRKCF